MIQVEVYMKRGKPFSKLKYYLLINSEAVL